jgi:hypothetical protein
VGCSEKGHVRTRDEGEKGAYIWERPGKLELVLVQGS